MSGGTLPPGNPRVNLGLTGQAGSYHCSVYSVRLTGHYISHIHMNTIRNYESIDRMHAMIQVNYIIHILP